MREYFPLLDNAVRARTGATVAEHTERIGRMWSNYSRVAADEPVRVVTARREPDEITTVTDDNRMICFPYTKVMNAYARVDQAAAVILCSAETARDLGIPDDRWVLPLAGADCDEGFVSERADLGVSAGMRANVGRARRRRPASASTMSPISTSTPASPRRLSSRPRPSACRSTTRAVRSRAPAASRSRVAPATTT